MSETMVSVLTSAIVSVLLGLIGLAATVVKVRGKADDGELQELKAEVAECERLRQEDRVRYVAEREADRVNYVRERDVLLAESQRLNAVLMDMINRKGL